MSLKELSYLLHSDMYRYMGTLRIARLVKHLIFVPGVSYTLVMRICGYLRSKPFGAFGLFLLVRLLLNHYSIKYGINIPDTVKIGSGFYIGHYGGIVVNGSSVIGKNCNISHGVTIGELYRGSKAGCPMIGNNVFIGPGAKIFGNIRIGDNVAVGANSVVMEDVPDNSVVAGNPGKVISQKGSQGYINNIDY